MELSSGRGKVLGLWHRESRHVLDADVQGVSIPHLDMMAGLAAEVADGNCIGLIENFSGLVLLRHRAKEALVCEANQRRNSKRKSGI